MRIAANPATDEPISVERGGQTYYFLTDALGSVTEIVDGSGQLVQSYKYDSYGRIVARSSSFADTYTYAWKTQKAWAGWCGTLTVRLDDDRSYELAVKFKP